jgi:hypothetical protein
MSTPSPQSSESPEPSELHFTLSGDKWFMHASPTEMQASGNSSTSSPAEPPSFTLIEGRFPLKSFTSQHTAYEGLLPSPPAGEDGRGICGPEWVPSITHVYTFTGSDGTMYHGKLTGFTWDARDGRDGCELTLTIIV